MRRITMMALAVSISVHAAAQSGQILIVPDAYPTVQSAVDAAVTGDTVLVRSGVHAGPVVITKAIILRGEGGASNTHITSTRVVQLPIQGVVHIDAPQPGQVVLEGLTIRNCVSPAIAIRSSTLVSRCVIRDNQATGVLCLDTTLMEHCQVVNNRGADGESVSGSMCFGSPSGRVGGVYVLGNLSCVNCRIAENQGGDASLVGFPCGAPPGNGGAGAFSSFGAVINLMNCTVTRNIGGATFFGSPGAGGLRFTVHGPHVRNSIIHGNSGADYDDASFPFPGLLPADIEHSNVGGYIGPGAGNIDADPLFLDPMNGDYRLTSASPCRDAGDHTIPNLPLVDLDGVPRIVGADVDMGCYEFVQPLPGTDEGLELRTTIDGEGADLHRKFAPGGSDLIASIEDDLGLLAGAVPVLLGQVFGNDTPPAGIPSFPLHLDFPELAVFHDGNATPGPLIGPIPVAFGPVTMPPGLGGLTQRLQAFGLSASASNATHAATHGRDLEFR